jgi:hypothetical protein
MPGLPENKIDFTYENVIFHQTIASHHHPNKAIIGALAATIKRYHQLQKSTKRPQMSAFHSRSKSKEVF